MAKPTQIHHQFRWPSLSAANTQRLEGPWESSTVFSGCWLQPEYWQDWMDLCCKCWPHYSIKWNITSSPSGWKLSQEQFSFSECQLSPYEWWNGKFYNILKFQDICLFGIRKKRWENVTPFFHSLLLKRKENRWYGNLNLSNLYFAPLK